MDVTHEHVSVPFYMDGSYRAAVDLKRSVSGIVELKGEPT
jgi:hypothetical protein